MRVKEGERSREEREREREKTCLEIATVARNRQRVSLESSIQYASEREGVDTGRDNHR
jgi:hypothetical protein